MSGRIEGGENASSAMSVLPHFLQTRFMDLLARGISCDCLSQCILKLGKPVCDFGRWTLMTGLALRGGKLNDVVENGSKTCEVKSSLVRPSISLAYDVDRVRHVPVSILTHNQSLVVVPTTQRDEYSSLGFGLPVSFGNLVSCKLSAIVRIR